MDKIKNALTRKFGPLPAWAWLALAGAAYYLYTRYSGSSSSSSGSTTVSSPINPAGTPAITTSGTTGNVGSTSGGSASTGGAGSGNVGNSAALASAIAGLTKALSSVPAGSKTTVSSPPLKTVAHRFTTSAKRVPKPKTIHLQGARQAWQSVRAKSRTSSATVDRTVTAHRISKPPVRRTPMVIRRMNTLGQVKAVPRPRPRVSMTRKVVRQRPIAVTRPARREPARPAVRPSNPPRRTIRTVRKPTV